VIAHIQARPAGPARLPLQGDSIDARLAVVFADLPVSRRAGARPAGQLARGVQELAESGASLDQVFTAALSEMRQSGIAHLSPHGPCFSVGASIGESFGPGDPGATRTVCVQPGIYIPGKASIRIGRTHCLKVSPAPAHDRIQLIPVGSLAGAAPYFSQPFSVDTLESDRYTEFLIGDRPGSWEGGT